MHAAQVCACQNHAVKLALSLEDCAGLYTAHTSALGITAQARQYQAVYVQQCSSSPVKPVQRQFAIKT
jgi:hypothetical protein